uniref:NSL1 component of MIS12 kinetochore complex n=1 Tax=Buteo japonicus TaxID=224669 RepID=A0A8C0B9A7_9AVES
MCQGPGTKLRRPTALARRLAGVCSCFRRRGLCSCRCGVPVPKGWLLKLSRALQNFETAVQENVTVNGQPWEETSDDSELQSSNIKILEDQFDELIVETTKKRKQWPKKILMHAIQTMKAEQELLVIKVHGYIFALNLRYFLTYIAFRDFSVFSIYQSLPALIERAEGFSQALTWQPTLELCKLRQEVFAGCKAKEENNVQNFISPGEVTPTDADTSENAYVLLKKKKAADSPERRRYPLRRRKITLST